MRTVRTSIALLAVAAVVGCAPQDPTVSPTVTASENRSQLQNRRAALARLTTLLADAIAPPARARRATKPSRGAKRARLEAKRHRGQIKRQRRAGPDE